jgi:hypothetical protein
MVYFVRAVVPAGLNLNSPALRGKKDRAVCAHEQVSINDTSFLGRNINDRHHSIYDVADKTIRV